MEERGTKARVFLARFFFFCNFTTQGGFCIPRSILVIVLVFFLAACSSSTENTEKGFPIKGKFPDVKLVNYDGSDFRFSDLRGNVVVVSYIYTHCPDICHIISKRIDVFKKKLDPDLLEKVRFVSISIDPARDTPDALKRHGGMMKLDTTNWYFVTGIRDRVYDTIKVAGIDPLVEIRKGPDDYTLNHRNRISLLDTEGNIRKHYKGTTFDYAELEEDIRKLLGY